MTHFFSHLVEQHGHSELFPEMLTTCANENSTSTIDFPVFFLGLLTKKPLNGRLNLDNTSFISSTRRKFQIISKAGRI